MIMKTWYFRFLQTPLGLMLAIADDATLYFLEFTDQKDFEKHKMRLMGQSACAENRQGNFVLDLVENELEAYFTGKLQNFSVPVCFQGTLFQRQTWSALQIISCGQRVSYQQLAQSVGLRNGHRAVANANSKNKIAIVVPCHRVVLATGKLGGYAGGIDRKAWLLAHEKTMNGL